MVDDRQEGGELLPDKFAEIPKLVELATDYLTKHSDILFETDDRPSFSSIGSASLKCTAVLPCCLSELVFHGVRSHYLKHQNDDTPIIKAVAKTPRGTFALASVNLINSLVDDDTLCSFMKTYRKRLRNLCLTSCNELTTNIHFRLVSEVYRMPELVALNVSDLLPIFGEWILREENCPGYEVIDPEQINSHHKPLQASATAPYLSSLLSRAANTATKRAYSFASQCAKMSRKMNDTNPTNKKHYIANNNNNNNDNAADDNVVNGDDCVMMEQNVADNTDTACHCECRSFDNGDFSTFDFELTTDSSTVDHQVPTTSAGTNGEPCRRPKVAPIITDICPNLISLTLHGEKLRMMFNETQVGVDKEQVVADFFQRVLQPLSRLRILDISSWTHVGDLSYLCGLKLTILILFDVPELYKTVDVLCKMQNLELLDLSQSSHETGRYDQPVTTLSRLVSSLPRLHRLDISFTNLASNPVKGDWPKPPKRRIESDIYGLQGLHRKLNFLGLFACDTAAYYQRIPAHVVTGEATEPQLLLSLEQYIRRPVVLQAVLNEVFQLYRFNAASEYVRAMHLLLDIMEAYRHHVQIQIASSASMFYIMRNVRMNFSSTNRTIGLLLEIIELHHKEQTLVRNCCLSICQFDIAVELSHVYVEAFKVLLLVLREYSEHTIQRVVVHILNTLACAGQNDQKLIVGEMGTVSAILDIIRQRLETQNCDEVMETAWSFLWNITDESSSNCKIFLEEKGLELFGQCYEAFSDKHGLLRNMMGLIGNIAEVRYLRSGLTLPHYLEIFCELLNDLSEGIEISYNSAGVLAHILSDTSPNSEDAIPNRQEISSRVIKAVKMWQMTAKRYINYRSFEPIIRLLSSPESPASRYWAVWALANLTTVDEVKYCKFVVEEKGVDVLHYLLSNEGLSPGNGNDSSFYEMVRVVLRNVDSYLSTLTSQSTTVNSSLGSEDSMQHS